MQKGSAKTLVALSLTVNGDAICVAVPAQRTLAELLRYDLGLTGTKQGCDKGDCGACTVRVDGRAILSCITLALEVEGANVETVESLARGTKLDPLQSAFIEHGAAQCGFCTPGMLVSAKSLIDSGRAGSADAIRAGLAGNLCRCTGYQKIIDAVLQASAAEEAEPSEVEGE